MPLRQPIVSVLGHVDHGKTSLLDQVRGTSVAKKEYGQITQHIGATEVPIDTIYSYCRKIIGSRKFNIPGLLFIDTPGHQAFTTLRSRGGALADLAVVVVDIKEGVLPQTIESLKILRIYKTPFLIAANKIDLIYGWRSTPEKAFTLAFKDQREDVQKELDERIYKLAEQLYSQDFSGERYDRIEDFTKNVAIVPVSAKLGIGVPDLLMVLVGLAQRFLETNLKTEECPGIGTVLEVKEEKGLGPTVDVILYQGTLKKGDIIVVGGSAEPVASKVKVMLKPRPLDEMRDPRDKFLSINSVSAAAGIKVVGPMLENAVSGTSLRVATLATLDQIMEEIKKESMISIKTEEEGIIVKADAIGSLEAMAYELKELGVPIKKAEIGDVSRRDVVNAITTDKDFFKIILAYNVKILPDAKKEIGETNIIAGNIIYQIIEEYKTWKENKILDLEKKARRVHVYPAKIIILEGNIFRVSKPAIVGVRVLAGTLRSGVKVLKLDGKVVGTLKSIRENEKSLEYAIMGAEVAVAIDNGVVGRNLKEGEILYTDVNSEDVKFLKTQDLSYEEKETLEEIIKIKRKEDQFWGL